MISIEPTYKDLSLTNVISRELTYDESIEISESNKLQSILSEFDRYIEKLCAIANEPLIMKTELRDNGKNDIIYQVSYIWQLDSYIQKVSDPYRTKKKLLLSDCLYVRYDGSKTELFSAYWRIQIAAKERNITLSKEFYSLFISDYSEANSIVSEIYVPRLT